MSLEEIALFARRVAEDETLNLDVRDCAAELAELVAGTKAPWANHRLSYGEAIRLNGGHR